MRIGGVRTKVAGVHVADAGRSPANLALPAGTARSARPRSSHLVAWLFGIALVAVVVLVVTHRTEERALLALFRRAAPAWLLVAVTLQICTYLADASTLRFSLTRAGWPRPLRTLVGLSFAKLFMDQVVPSGGFSGTLLLMRSLDKRGVPRGVTLGAVLLDLIAYYSAYLLALTVALGVAAASHDLAIWVLAPAVAFALGAAGIIGGLLVLVFRGYGALPKWLRERRWLGPLLDDLDQVPRQLFRDLGLFGKCVACELAVFAFDATTLWILLYALGEQSPPVLVFAAFMLATLARTIGVMPGGLGTFEGMSVAMLHLMGVPVAAGLAATLLFRGLSFWLPMGPGILLARHESKSSRPIAPPERR